MRGSAAGPGAPGAARDAALVFGVALVVRVAAVLLMNALYRRYIFANDSAVYDTLAVNLLRGAGYTVPGRANVESIAPLFPVYLAGIYAVWGRSALVVGLCNAVVGATTPVAVALLGRGCFSPRAGLAAGLIAALYPIQVFNTAYVLKDTLAIALYAWAAVALLLALSRPAWWWPFLAGVALGLDTLARYLMRGFFVVAAALMAYYLWRRSRGRAAAWIGLSFAGLALVLAPWVIRGIVLGRDSFVTVEGVGAYLYAGNGPGLQGETWGYYEARGLDTRAAFPANAGNVPRPRLEARLWQATWRFVERNPATFAAHLGDKLVNMWRPTWAGSSTLNQVVFGGSYVAMLLLAGVGVVLGRRRGRYQGVLYGGFAFIFLVHLVFYGMIRYRQFAEPFLIAFAGLAFAGLVAHVPALRSRLQPGPAGQAYVQRA